MKKFKYIILCIVFKKHQWEKIENSIHSKKKCIHCPTEKLFRL